jgi:hypothetical protein
MQPMALQLSLDLAVQEAVQDSNKETLESTSGVAARWCLFMIRHKYQLTRSLPVFVGVAKLPAQPFLELYCHFSVSPSNVTYL